MSRKLVLIMALTVVLMGMPSVAFKVRMVKASGSIYIDASGNVVGTDKIQRNGNLYTFTANINDTIVVQRSNIIIDGKGFALQGSRIGRGFIVYGINNVTVQNTSIEDFDYGVDFESTNNIVVSGNTITNSTSLGVYLCLSNNSVVFGNTITNSLCGVNLWLSNNIAVSGNTITNSTSYGVRLWLSNSSVVSGNTITNSTSYGVALESSSSSVVSGNTITNSSYFGVYSASSSNITVSGNTITNSSDGIYLYSFNNTVVSGNTITSSTDTGVCLGWSSSSVVSENTITNSLYYGIYLYSSDNTVVSGNTITNSTAYGVYLYSSNNSAVSGNTITNITECGVCLYSSSNNNKIYHNNFINNSYQAYVSSDSLNNIWDDGYPSGGNYWSDYNGTDLYKGPNQDILGSDFIGDTHYEIDQNNTDHYPLMIPYETQPPTITLQSPENKTYAVNASIPLTFTVDEFASWMGYSLNGQANVTISGNTTLPILPDGGHYVNVYANDTFGNMGSATVCFTVDTTKPNITNVVQNPPTDILPGTVVKINATVTDATSGIKQVILNYTTGDGTWITVGMTNLEAEIWNATIPAFSYGTNVTYVILAEDNAGNTITTEQIYGYKYEYPVVPEFPLPVIFLAFMIATLPITKLLRKKRTFPT